MARAAGTQTMANSRKPRMRKIGPSLYLVESISTPGIGHKLDVARGICGCKAGQFGRRCHHLDWAEALDRWYCAQQALMAQRRQAPAPAPQIARPSGMAALLECFV